VSPAGIPDGWEAEEQEDLRFGVWRFYRIVDPEARSDVREDNLAVRDGVPMWGEAGLRTFLEDVDPFADPHRVPAPKLVAQLAHWFVRGESRRPSRIRLEDAPEPPSCDIEDGRFVARGWFDRGGVRRQLTVTLDRASKIAGRWR
jgi:hypothetical protein